MSSKRAFQIVSADPPMREEIYKIQSGLHVLPPQAPVIVTKDSVVHDSIPFAVIDSIKAICPGASDSLIKALTKTITVYRTTTVTIPDSSWYRQYLNTKDDLFYQSQEKYTLQGNVQILEKTNSGLEKLAKNRLILLIVLCVALAGAVVLIFKK